MSLDDTYETILGGLSTPHPQLGKVPLKMTDAERRRLRMHLEELTKDFVSQDTLLDQCYILTRMLYSVLVGFVELGVRPQIPFDIIHQTNQAHLPPWTRKDDPKAVLYEYIHGGDPDATDSRRSSDNRDSDFGYKP